MSALWVFVPALGAPIVHAPILRWDLFPSLKLPDGIQDAGPWLYGLLLDCGWLWGAATRSAPGGRLSRHWALGTGHWAP